MNEPALDPVVFDEMRELMDDAMGTFITTYLGNSPKLISEMEQGLMSGDSNSIQHSAHQLKGGSGSIGALVLSGLAQQIEQMARDRTLDGIGPLLDRLKMEFSRVDAELRDHMG